MKSGVSSKNDFDRLDHFGRMFSSAVHEIEKSSHLDSLFAFFESSFRCFLLVASWVSDAETNSIVAIFVDASIAIVYFAEASKLPWRNQHLVPIKRELDSENLGQSVDDFPLVLLLHVWSRPSAWTFLGRSSDLKVTN